MLLGKHLYHYRFDYREEWLRFTHTLSFQEPAQDVGQRIVRGLPPAGVAPAEIRGASRFGRALAEALAVLGARLVLNARGSDELEAAWQSCGAGAFMRMASMWVLMRRRASRAGMPAGLTWGHAQ